MLEATSARTQLFDWGLCITVRFTASVARAPFVEPGAPTYVVPIQELEHSEIACVSDHLSFDEEGYYLKQCYNGPKHVPRSLTITDAGPTALTRPSRNGDFLHHTGDIFYVTGSQLTDAVWEIEETPPKMLQNSTACLALCKEETAVVCPPTDSSHAAVLSRSGIHISPTLVYGSDYYVVCALPNRFLSCSELTAAGICVYSPCLLKKKEDAFLTADKHLVHAVASGIQPLTDPFMFCLSNFPSSLYSVKTCTEALVLLSSSYDSDTFRAKLTVDTKRPSRVFHSKSPLENKKLWPMVILSIIVAGTFALYTLWRTKLFTDTRGCRSSHAR